jgi:ABC-type polysaccharide/polyol phosphate transport system ATPase subunit
LGTTAVAVEGVSKRFRLYHEKYTSLKEKVIHAGRVPHEDLWALRDLSFEVQEGETVGILGRNGSGKSTLLKCVCGVLQPTAGQIRVRGKLAGLLELGAGFQPELSGRDNIYLNGSMLGLSKREVDRMFDDIVEFAELGQFIDNQVKFYSSGMYVRLGFAVAVNVDPDVLVIDEVLAVGDERFQRKCTDRVRQFQREGRTILFVSHSPDQVRSICDRAVVLSDGVMIGLGSPGEAVRLFRERLLEAGDVLALGIEEVPPPPPEDAVAHPPVAPEPAAPGTFPIVAPKERADDSRPVRFTEVTAFFPAEHERRYLLPGEPLTVRVAFEASQRTADAVFQIEVRTSEGNPLFRTDTEILGVTCDLPGGPGAVDFEFDSVPLFDGAYDILVGVQTGRGLSDWREPACRFEVMNPGRATGVVSLPVRVRTVAAEMIGTPPGERGAL